MGMHGQIAGSDQAVFFRPDFYQLLDAYIDEAPAGANEAIAKPRYHGSAGTSHYMGPADPVTGRKRACAGGYCVENLFTPVNVTDPAYFDHTLDMGLGYRRWTHQMFTYNPDVVHDEQSGTWEKIPVRACRTNTP